MAGAAAGAGAAASVAGGVMQAVAADIARQRMERELERELQRQQAYRNEALGVFQPGLEKRGAETAEKQISAGAEKRLSLYDQLGKLQFGLQPNLVSRDQANYRLRGIPRARLGGYSDWALDQMINHIRTQDMLNKISNFAGGTAQVFPYRMSDAQHSMDELATWGAIIGSIGGGAPAIGSIFGNQQQVPQQQQQQQPVFTDQQLAEF